MGFFSSDKPLSKRWWAFALYGVILLICVHVGMYFWHTHLVREYDRIQSKIQLEKLEINIPPSFIALESLAHERSVFTRPDILIRETFTLSGGIGDLQDQYIRDKQALHDRAVALIAAFRHLDGAAMEMMIPDFHAKTLADETEQKIKTPEYSTMVGLKRLIAITEEKLSQEREKFETARRNLLIQNVEGLDSEITFLDSLYTVNPDVKLEFDTKSLRKFFKDAFGGKKLELSELEPLEASFGTINAMLEPYREESREIRRLAREKRAELVAKEAEKWTEETPPEPFLNNIYEQINISLKEQMMYAYEDGQLILSTAITSGRRNFETVKGNFKIYNKERNHLMKSPFEDEDYELWVDYWLPFYGAYGIHDSCNSKDCWRTRFGGSSFVYNGSHGCVNTPYKEVKWLYSWAHVGTTVHVE